MTDVTVPEVSNPDLGQRIVYWLALALVIIGLVNALPGIPGLDEWAADLAGNQWFVIRKFPFEYYYPFFFSLMMITVALQHSMWRDWANESRLRRRFGLFMDLALVFMALAIAFSYMNEIESVCLMDQFTGDRARLIAESLKIEIENAALFGLPEPTTVDDPKCLNSVGGWLVAIVGLAVIVFLTYNIKVWGLPLVVVALLVAGYTIATVLVWYVFGADDMNKYLVTKLGGDPRTLADGYPRVHDILTNNASGLLGRFMDIILNEIFPYLILGSLFGASAGGKSLIKLAFRWTRHLQGGPAHAAIVSSAMFRHNIWWPHCQCAFNGCVDHSDDDPARVQPGFCRWYGSSGLIWWLNHAAGHGSGGFHSGCPDCSSLQPGHHCSDHSGSGLFSVPVSFRGFSGPQTEYQSHRQTDR